MKLHLSNGGEVNASLTSATMGLQVNAVTLTGEDMRLLLQWDNDRLRECLEILYTRFGPWSNQLKEKNT